VVKKLFSLIAVIALLSSQAFASGFQINEHSARAMAMGGAFAGLANDPSAMFFNPAGITQLSGTRFLAGVTIISPSASFRGPSPAITEYKLQHQTFTPINFYFTQQISNKLFFGASVNNPYGLGTKWDKDWVGKYVAYNTKLETFFFTGVLAYKLSENLSLSAGVIYATGKVTIERYTPLTPFVGDAFVSLNGSGNGLGFTAGLLFKASKAFSLGVSYRSSVKFDFTGTAKTTGPAQLAPRLPQGDISSSITTPQNITVGAAFTPNKKITLTADFQYVGWSSYDKLAVDFKNPAYTDLSAPRNYQNSFIVRFGTEYSLFENLKVRGGLYYDKNPVKDEYVDPTLPDADRIGFNIGFGFNLTKSVSLDVAYMFIRFNERKITNSLIEYSQGNSKFNGVYNAFAHLFGVNFSYNF